MLFLLSKIVLFCMEKLKHKGVFMKIEIIHVRHILSSLAQKQNSVDFSDSSCKLAMLSKVSYQKSRVASHSGNSDVQKLKLGLQSLSVP